jgi:F0F1-type ATP synthase epsilon subunit
VADPLRLVVWTPSERLIDAEQVEWVHLELVDDRTLTIWPRHAPLLAETAAGAVRYADLEGTHTVDLLSGVVHVRNDVVSLYLPGTLGSAVGEDAQPIKGEETGFERLARTMLRALETRQPS